MQTGWDGTLLARWVESIDLRHLAAMFAQHPVKDAQKGAVPKIGYLPAPKPLHGLDVQIFHGHEIVCAGQPERGFAVELLAQVDDPAALAGKIKPGPFPVGAPFLLGAEVFGELNDWR